VSEGQAQGCLSRGQDQDLIFFLRIINKLVLRTISPYAYLSYVGEFSHRVLLLNIAVKRINGILLRVHSMLIEECMCVCCSDSGFQSFLS